MNQKADNRKSNKPSIAREITDQWQQITDLMAVLFQVPSCLIMKVEPPDITVFISSASEGNPYKAGERAKLNTGLYCETVMETREMLLVPDAASDEDWMANPDVELGMISYLGLPVCWPNEDIFGTLCVLDNKHNAYNAIYQKILERFRILIESDLRFLMESEDHLLKEEKRVDIDQLKKTNRRILKESTRSRQAVISLLEDMKVVEARLDVRDQQHEVIAKLGQLALSKMDLTELMEQAVVSLAEILSVEDCEVMELLPDGKSLLLRAEVGWKEKLGDQAIVKIESESQAAYTLQSNEPIIVEDFKAEARFSHPLLLRDLGIVSGISTVIQGQEKPYGILGAHSATSRVFTQDDAQFVNSIANVLAQAIQRYESREKLKISEDQYADLYEHAPVMYVCVEVKTGLIRQCNNTVVDQLGYKKGEILGRPVFDLYHPECRQEAKIAFQIFSEIGELHDVELQLIGKDGSRMEVSLNATGECFS